MSLGVRFRYVVRVIWACLGLLVAACQPGAEVQPTGSTGSLRPTGITLAFTDSANSADVRTYTWRSLPTGQSVPVVNLEADRTYTFSLTYFVDTTGTETVLNPQLVEQAGRYRVFMLFDCPTGTPPACPNHDLLLPRYSDSDGAGRYLGLSGTLRIDPDVPGTWAQPKHGPDDPHVLRLLLQYQPEPNGKASTPLPDGSPFVGTTAFDAGFTLLVDE